MRRCLNHVFLLENYLDWKKPHSQTVAWSYDMEGHARTCIAGYGELANKKVEQQYKVSSPCLDDHQFKQEELGSVGELSEVCSHIFLEVLVFGTNWETKHSVVSQQACEISHKMDPGMLQTVTKAGFLHSSHM